MIKGKKARRVLLVSAAVIELVAVILMVKAIATDSSPTIGIVFLIFGMIFLIIGMTGKAENRKTETVGR
ncbi:MAG TPA: hypothetical protein VGA55_02405 [Bacteroidota bacterium]